MLEAIANYFGYYSEFSLGNTSKGYPVRAVLRGSERQKNGSIIMYREVQIENINVNNNCDNFDNDNFNNTLHPIMNATAEMADGRVRCVTDLIRQFSGPRGDFYGKPPSFWDLEYVVAPVETLHITWRDNPMNTLELKK